MSEDSNRMFARDLKGDLKGQKSKEIPQWKEVAFNKATTYGEIAKLSIQDQRKSLPIYKLRDPLLQAIADVRPFCAFHNFSAHVCSTASGAGRRWRHWLGQDNTDGAVPRGIRLRRTRSYRLHPTSSCGSHVRGETCC